MGGEINIACCTSKNLQEVFFVEFTLRYFDFVQQEAHVFSVSSSTGLINSAQNSKCSLQWFFEITS